MIETILLGTYTKQTSKGIYQVELDSTKERLQNLKLVAQVQNPTYLSVSKQNILYAVDQFNGNGGLSTINLNQNNQVLDHVVQPGTPPAYVTIDNKKQLVFDANYHEGRINAYQIEIDHTLTLQNTFNNEGSGPLPQQESAHPHYVDRTPDDNLVVCDLGTDEVFILSYDKNLGFKTISVFHTHPGFGPRHIVFNHAGNLAYLVGELSSEVEVLSYQNGQFEELQTISTIPGDWNKANGSAAIRISNDNRYLYVSNRGYDSIAVFSINPDGTLNLIQNAQISGSFPRDFALNQDEKFLVCANQKTNNLTLFKRNPDDGKLTIIQKDFEAPEAVCVYFK